MLIMFKVKNYCSFKEEAILDLRAASYKQHVSHLLDTPDGTKLVKTAAIYGANASGKSNFISAMYFFEKYIFQQFISKRDLDEWDFHTKTLGDAFDPFRLNENYNKVSEFDIIFISGGDKIQYGFECTADEVLNEWYYINDKKVFERIKVSVTYGNKYVNNLKVFQKVPKERLYLSVLEYFLEEEEKKIILNKFIRFFREEYNVFLEIFFESTIKNVAGFIYLNQRLVDDKSFRNRVEEYLKQADVGIKGLDLHVKTVVGTNGQEKEQRVIRTIHDIYDNHGNIAGQRLFELQQESTGTLRFLAYIQEVIRMTEKGGVFVVDEISARLHPLLTKLIIDIFQDSKNTKAQLIFTTHDISLLKKEQFRRDEVIFIDKNLRGESSLYSLSDLKVRDDATFHREYLQGKYGAIPIFDYNSLLEGV